MDRWVLERILIFILRLKLLEDELFESNSDLCDSIDLKIIEVIVLWMRM